MGVHQGDRGFLPWVAFNAWARAWPLLVTVVANVVVLLGLFSLFAYAEDGSPETILLRAWAVVATVLLVYACLAIPALLTGPDALVDGPRIVAKGFRARVAFGLAYLLFIIAAEFVLAYFRHASPLVVMMCFPVIFCWLVSRAVASAFRFKNRYPG